MSESNPIKGSDIIEEGALSNAIEQAQKLTLIYSDLEKGIKAIAGSSKSFLGVDPKSVKDIQEQTKRSFQYLMLDLNSSWLPLV